MAIHGGRFAPIFLPKAVCHSLVSIQILSLLECTRAKAIPFVLVMLRNISEVRWHSPKSSLYSLSMEHSYRERSGPELLQIRVVECRVPEYFLTAASNGSGAHAPTESLRLFSFFNNQVEGSQNQTGPSCGTTWTHRTDPYA